MAKKQVKSSSQVSEVAVPRKPNRQAFGAVDAVVIAAMGVVCVAAGIGLHLQGSLSTVTAAAMGGGLFVLFALLHLQKRRIDSLRAAAPSDGRAWQTVTPQRQEPALERPDQGDAAIEIASSRMAAAAAALRDGETSTRHRRAPTLGPVLETVEDQVDGPLSGWGEPGAVDALVRQYAKELDRAPPEAEKPGLARSPKPALADPSPDFESAPPAESATAKAVRRAAAGEVEIHLQPIVSFADRKARMYEVFPRILDAGGKALSFDDYRADAERLGLSLAVERAAIMRCAAIQRKLSERGRARAMIFRLSSPAIRDQAFLQRLVVDLKPDPLLTDLMVLEVDQRDIEEGDGAERENMEYLGSAGFRFSLGRAETLALEVDELRARRIGFVRVTPDLLNVEQNPMAVSDLRNGGIETIITSIVREEDIRIGRAFGLVLGQGPLFSEPKPLRADVAGAATPPTPEPAAKKAGRVHAA